MIKEKFLFVLIFAFHLRFLHGQGESLFCFQLFAGFKKGYCTKPSHFFFIQRASSSVSVYFLNVKYSPNPIQYRILTEVNT